MKEDLEAEKRALTKHWAKRQKQLSQVVKNMAAMYGDIQGISGNALQKIEALSLEEMSVEFLWPLYIGFSHPAQHGMNPTRQRDR